MLAQEIGIMTNIKLMHLKNEMLGKKRFRDIIRAQADKHAKEILNSVITGPGEFRHPLEKEDDVTLVIIKVLS